MIVKSLLSSCNRLVIKAHCHETLQWLSVKKIEYNPPSPSFHSLRFITGKMWRTFVLKNSHWFQVDPWFHYGCLWGQFFYCGNSTLGNTGFSLGSKFSECLLEFGTYTRLTVTLVLQPASLLFHLIPRSAGTFCHFSFSWIEAQTF